MCLFTTSPTRRTTYIEPPPRHISRYSAHPPPGVVRLPRNSTTSHHSHHHHHHRSSHDYRRSTTSSLSEPRVIEYRRSRSRSRPAREIEYYEERDGYGGRSSRRSFVEEDYRASRGSGFGGRDQEYRRSVSRVRY